MGQFYFQKAIVINIAQTHGEVQPVDEAGWWQAVLSRDDGCDGVFVYAVRSTGIYCRPSCPSRRPQRNRVVFFQRSGAAEQAGFRPCKRCHPDRSVVPEPQADLVERLCRYIDAHLEQTLTLDALGAHVGVSPNHLQRTFKRLMGITPRQYADTRRMDGLKAQLREGQEVTTALYEAGYSSSSRLYERSAEQLGMTPATYRRGGVGMQIVYAVAQCSLGMLLVAATARGICAISLGDGEHALEGALAKEFPGAELRRDEAALGEWMTALLAHLSGQQPHLDLPLDVRASAFQRRVWEELRSIPYGSTKSYGEIARALGQPTAARAVARACATNPAALVIPCHRVVGEGGKLSGYRWGLERKEALLAGEREPKDREQEDIEQENIEQEDKRTENKRIRGQEDTVPSSLF